MVERGLGLSFLPEYIVRDALAAGRVARLNVPDCTVTMRRQLFYHKDKWLTPQMKAFMELAQQSPAEGTCQTKAIAYHKLNLNQRAYDRGDFQNAKNTPGTAFPVPGVLVC